MQKKDTLVDIISKYRKIGGKDVLTLTKDNRSDSGGKKKKPPDDNHPSGE